MNLKKYAPWNWFHHEEEKEQKVPVHTELARPASGYPISQLHREIDRLFDDAFRSFPGISGSRWELPDVTPIMLSPSLDIKETEEDYVVSVEVPGVDKDDIDIRVEDNILTIQGEKKQETRKDEENYHCVERRYGSFARTLSLPQDANAEDIQASFKDGVLSIRINRKAKTESEEAKKIEVQQS
jgi:HSP20 family protein